MLCISGPVFQFPTDWIHIPAVVQISRNLYWHKSFVSDESIGVKSLQMALVFHLNQLLELWASWSSYSWNLTLAWYQIFVFSFPLTLTTVFLNKSKPLYRSRGISKTTPEIKIYHPLTPPYTLLNPPHSKKSVLHTHKSKWRGPTNPQNTLQTSTRLTSSSLSRDSA